MYTNTSVFCFCFTYVSSHAPMCIKSVYIDIYVHICHIQPPHIPGKRIALNQKQKVNSKHSRSGIVNVVKYNYSTVRRI